MAGPTRQRFRLSTRLAGLGGLVAAATLAAVVVLARAAAPGQYRDPVILPVLTAGCSLSGICLGLAAVLEYRAIGGDRPVAPRGRTGRRIALVITYGLVAAGLFLYLVAVHTV